MSTSQLQNCTLVDQRVKGFLVLQERLDFATAVFERKPHRMCASPGKGTRALSSSQSPSPIGIGSCRLAWSAVSLIVFLDWALQERSLRSNFLFQGNVQHRAVSLSDAWTIIFPPLRDFQCKMERLQAYSEYSHETSLHSCAVYKKDMLCRNNARWRLWKLQKSMA